ncbi:MAG: hypothetical protein ABIP16_00600 [Thermomonas sp.]
MIFRRFACSLRRQDWAAVAVELVVVIVGVYIGLQASNWNEDRQTDAKAADFAERLRSDLREEAWGYEMQIGYYNQVLASAELTVDALAGKKSLPDEALLIEAYRATQYNGNVRRRATYDELTSTGEIGLIRDPALRDLAMRVYTTPIHGYIVEDARTSAYRSAFRMVLPRDVQQALAERCGDRSLPVGDYVGIAHALDYPCSTGLSPQVIADSATILRNDPGLVPMLQLLIANIKTGLGNMTVYFKQDMRDPLRNLAQEKP